MSKTFDLHSLSPEIICQGSHPPIIQSMLDYNYAIGSQKPNILAIIAGGHKQERFFWGESEIIIPVYPSLEAVPDDSRQKAQGLLNVQSARRSLGAIKEALAFLPNLKVATIFAENVPETHALEIARLTDEKAILLAGPASVGILVPGMMKLGAIGGIMYAQLVTARIFEPGNTAVVSTSGGMVNELIHTVTGSGHGVSFAIALGGDRYPVTNPAKAFLMAEADSQTKQIVFFGELGGDDEYLLAELMKQKKVTKPVIAYIAGSVAELFDEPPQFGHAKAMASTKSETAEAKKVALRDAGAVVIDVFADLSQLLLKGKEPTHMAQDHKEIKARKKSLAVSRISGDVDGDVQLLGQDLLKIVDSSTLAGLDISMLLGHEVKSKRLIGLTDFALRLLVDHGPYVSGAVNTIVSARAGKDLASSLTSGILTIGPRFGGAVNGAADAWLKGVQTASPPKDFVANFRANGGIIPGIGHKKYRIDVPDPRVKALLSQFNGNTNKDRYLKFAQGVEAVTTSKKSNLILNVDGAIAAVMLDVLESELGYSQEKLQELVDIEFFNAIFILSRSVGFAAHYLDQRRNDEGLLRLGEGDIAYIP